MVSKVFQISSTRQGIIERGSNCNIHVKQKIFVREWDKTVWNSAKAKSLSSKYPSSFTTKF
jgi:hypothetical protein